jgi:hypothetical protein
MAILQDRKLADLVYLIARKYAYGNVNPQGVGDQGTEGDSDAP